MTTITVTFLDDGAHVPIIHKADGIEFLLHQFQETQRREEMFKEAMMKAQSQSDLMRRFIPHHGRQSKFAAFVLEGRGPSCTDDVLAEFGFTGPDPISKEDRPGPE